MPAWIIGSKRRCHDISHRFSAHNDAIKSDPPILRA
jgi:hypothetical protein